MKEIRNQELVIPFKRIPNIRDLRVRLGKLDETLLKHGLKKRKGTKLEFEKWHNRPQNRYLEWSSIRLNRSVHNPRKFWRIGEYLLRRSTTYGMSCLYKVMPNWPRKVGLTTVKKIWTEYESIRKERGYKLIDLKRIYVPKDGGKWRPIGSPTISWRMYLCGWGWLLSIYLYDHISRHQHGFIPNRGTLTAWSDVMSKVEKCQGIWEYDLKQCFEQIKIGKIISLLREIGMPEPLLQELHTLNSSYPKLPKEEKVDESRAKAKKERIEQEQELEKKLGKGVIWSLRSAEHVQTDYAQAFLKAVTGYENSMNYAGHLKKGLLVFGTKKEESEETIRNRMLREELAEGGLPQGSAMSPILTNLGIQNSVLGLLDHVMYADDGLIFDVVEDLDPKELNNPEIGIEINEEKSRWVKKNGKWLRPLKFLGLVYHGESKILESQTRSGRQLRMTKWKAWEDWRRQEKLSWLLEGTASKNYSWSAKIDKEGASWHDFFQSKIRGYILSRMYIGKWNLEEFYQQFNLTFSKGSWVHLQMKDKKDTYNWGHGFRGGPKITIFNSTSLAADWLKGWIKHRKIRGQSIRVGRSSKLGR
jgi:hypothetical protein